jgi:hypothetical protein
MAASAWGAIVGVEEGFAAIMRRAGRGFLKPDLAIRLDLTEGGTIIWRSDWNHF